MTRHIALGRFSGKVGNIVYRCYRVLLVAGMASIMLVLSCRTSKDSNRQKARVDIKHQTDLSSALIKDNQFVRTTSLSDSAGETYQLTIFPVDSFNFSLQNGFSGKATKVMIMGSSKQMTRISDTSKYTGSLTAEYAAKLTESVNANASERSNSVEKSTVLGKWLWLVFVGIAIVIAVRLKLFKWILALIRWV